MKITLFYLIALATAVSMTAQEIPTENIEPEDVASTSEKREKVAEAPKIEASEKPAPAQGPSIAEIVATTATQTFVGAATNAFLAKALGTPAGGNSVGGMSVGMGKWELNGGLSYNDREINRSCYGKVNNNATGTKGSTTTIIFSGCEEAAGPSVSAFGKVGDITLIPLAQLKLVHAFGQVSQPTVQQFAIPAMSSASDWRNAIYFTFKLTNPQISEPWQKQGVTEAMLKGKEAQIVMRSRALTPELAQSIGKSHAYNATEKKLLLEVWIRTSPSITGSKNFKEIFNIILSAQDVGKNLALGVQGNGDATIGFIFKDPQNSDVIKNTSTFNVTIENP